MLTLDNKITPERFGQTAVLVPTTLPAPTQGTNIATLVHPTYDALSLHWEKWRLTFDGGEEFLERYLRKFSASEEDSEFNERKNVTPIPTFAKAGINEIKNAIAQRLPDVSRNGGPRTYQQGVQGKIGGVNLKGNTLNWFIAEKVLPELLVMKKVGVMCDNFQLGQNESILSKGNKHPYFYIYRAEDIRSWGFTAYEDENVLQNVLLRDYKYLIDDKTGLPLGEVEQFRFIWIAEDGFVYYQLFDNVGNQVNEPVRLNLTKIPFHIFEISDSLMKDVANYQIALLNLESSDISFLLRGNVPFYIEEYDDSDSSQYLKSAQNAYQQNIGPTNPDGTPVIEGQPGWITDGNGITHATMGTPAEIKNSNDAVRAGPTRGRRYPKGFKPPAFIAPPTDSVKASILKQEALKNDIRNLIQLAVTNLKATSAPAEAKAMDQQGFESGLSAIGLELQTGENCLAYFWAYYEAETEAEIIYPTQFYLKTPEQFEKELTQKLKLREEIPSRTFQDILNADIVRLALGARISNEEMTKIIGEIKRATLYTNNPKTVNTDVESGLVGIETASLVRGWPKGEAERAKLDHAERLARIQQAQTPVALGIVGKQHAIDTVKTESGTNQANIAAGMPPSGNAGARGISDLAASTGDAKIEKIGKRGRGQAKG